MGKPGKKAITITQRVGMVNKKESVAKQTIGPFPEVLNGEESAPAEKSQKEGKSLTKTSKSKWNPESDPLVKELKTTKPGSRKAWKLQSEINEQQGSRKKYTRKEYKEKRGVPNLIAVHQDYTKTAFKIAFSINFNLAFKITLNIAFKIAFLLFSNSGIVINLSSLS